MAALTIEFNCYSVVQIQAYIALKEQGLSITGHVLPLFDFCGCIVDLVVFVRSEAGGSRLPEVRGVE